MAVLEITKENFKDTIEKNQTVILDFWAPWCGPCKRFAPTFETVSQRHPDVIFGKINTDEQIEIAETFEVKSIPTIVIIKESDIIFEQPGTLPEDVLEDIVTKAKEVDMVEVRRQNPR